MILSFLTWIFCFYSTTLIAFLSESSPIKDKYFAIICFIIMCSLIVIRLISDNILKTAPKKAIPEILLPFFIFCFFICHSNIKYGYGNTIGILGYSEEIGIFSILNISYNSAFVLLFISYALLWVALAFKAASALKHRIINLNYQKIYLCIMISAGCIVEIIGILTFLFSDRLSKLFVLSIMLHLIMQIIGIIIAKTKSFFYND